jgi:RNA-directed DNA polymerase
MNGTRCSNFISPQLQRVAEQAREHPEWAFTNLAQCIDLPLLREAYKRTRKDGAMGVDGVSSAAYERELESNLHELLRRAHTGTYRAPAVRRVHIPKGDGRTRPLGIPTFEDKVLQRAVHMVLEAVYERDFLPCSFGFRPHRSAHQALEVLWDGLTSMGGGWVLEADIKDCFGTLDHDHLRQILSPRIRDGVITRLIGKWLNAGSLEAGSVTYPERGSPQGGVISPLLANIYLHTVLDLWVRDMVMPCMRGKVFLIRYADDFVLVFEKETDARRVYEALPKRFGKYGLALHPEKTKLLDFRRPRREDSAGPTFDLLGFTHFWSRSRKGNWCVKRRTMSKRLNRSLKAVAEWCRFHRHVPVEQQHAHLSRVLLGHCGYYGITGNSCALRKFREGLRRAWRKWLLRRSRAARACASGWWDDFCRKYPIPPAKAIHSVLRTRS